MVLTTGANLLSAFVFTLFLLRHAISCALGIFPGENWLWRASYLLGFDLLPISSGLRDGLGCGVFGTFALLLALIIAANSKDLFVSLLNLHIAAFAIAFCWIVSIARYGSSFEIPIQPFQVEKTILMPKPLGILALSLLAACACSHARYIRMLRRGPGDSPDHSLNSG
jgi:hypothetical protein